MTREQIAGLLVVAFAGLLIGSDVWPMKLMKTFQFEHWWIVGMFTGLILIPWTVTILGCPHVFEAYSSIPTRTLITANLWAAGWGIANVLCGLCFVRIGVALTGAILTGLGVSIGLGSPVGLTVLAGVAVMLVGVILAALAGFGRDKILQKTQQRSGSFLGGLIMTVIAGVLSCGMSLSFVYSQGPIVEAMKARGAGELPATFAVWAVGLLAGSLINIIYPAWLLTKNRSWNVLGKSWKELLLASIIGLTMAVGIVLMGSGMVAVGVLGASVGFGIQQASQMLGGQCLGFISGEWRGVRGRPLMLMFAAIAILIVAALIMAYGNTLPKK